MKKLARRIGVLSIVVLFGAACGNSETATKSPGAPGGASPAGGAAGQGGTGQSGGGQGGAGQVGGSANGGTGATSGAAGSGVTGGSGATGGGAGSSGAGGTATGGSAGTGGTDGGKAGGLSGAGGSGTGGSAGSGGGSVVWDGGVFDTSQCCTLQPHSKTGCRLFINDWQECYKCDQACLDKIRPTAPVAPITACGCDGRPANTRCFKIENRCKVPVRVIDSSNALSKDLAPGACTQEFTNKGPRLHGETGCASGKCDPGPQSLIEINAGDLDWYDISHVDGANLPIGMYLSKGYDAAYTGPSPNGQCSCQNRECRVDIKSTTCKPDHQVKNALGQVTACKSQCAAHGTAAECCRNDGAAKCDRPAGYTGPYPICADYGVPYNCVPNHNAYDATGAISTNNTFTLKDDYEMMRFPCPQVYSYAYDEEHEVDGNYVLCTCAKHPDYDIVFCP